MSVSKDGKVYYTEDELSSAKQNNSALKYAVSRGYQLVRAGNEYHMKEHDSMVFKSDGAWFWNSKGLSGHALDFIQQYENRPFKEAVCLLAGTIDSPAPLSHATNISVLPAERKDFVLPERAQSYKIIFAYLIKERGIDQSLVRRLVSEKKIYQSKEHNNLIMVGYDSQNVPKYASLRSTNSYAKPFKIDVAGSDKSYPFIIDGTDGNDTVCVFESPIEAMSYWTLCKETQSDRVNCHMLSLGGAASQLSLDRFLKDNPQIKNIVVGLNNDSKAFGHSINAGRNGAQRIQEKYGESYNVTFHTPHMNDWNDVLKNYRSNLESKMEKLQQQIIKGKTPKRAVSQRAEI